jgi:hypothetical protein
VLQLIREFFAAEKLIDKNIQLPPIRNKELGPML